MLFVIELLHMSISSLFVAQNLLELLWNNKHAQYRLWSAVKHGVGGKDTDQLQFNMENFVQDHNTLNEFT